MSGCCCTVLAKYLASLLLLQYNFWCKSLLIASILAVGLIWNNAARCIQGNWSYMLVAQDTLRESLQQLYHCHNNAKSEVKAKLMSLQINLALKPMLGSRKGF